MAEGEAESHLPVMLDEVVFLLRPRAGAVMVDGTVGMGGHAERLMDVAGADARLLGIDADPEALARAGGRLQRFGDRVRLVQGSYRDVAAHAAAWGIAAADAVLLDLGVSSYQLDEASRGFSFQREEPLDMRFDVTRGASAADLLATLPEAELARIIFEHGGERHARRIARRIVERRRRDPLRTTGDLAAAVKDAVPRAAWPRRTHVATRTFQAVRVAVNDEAGVLRAALPAAARLLGAGGRLGVIAFHSGEDRIVKQEYRTLRGAGFVQLEPAPLAPGPAEIAANPRARSAKLRVLERAEAA